MKQRRIGIVREGRDYAFNTGVLGKVTLEQRPEGNKGMSHVANWGKSIPSNGWASAKALCLRISRDARVTQVE